MSEYRFANMQISDVQIKVNYLIYWIKTTKQLSIFLVSFNINYQFNLP